MSSTLMSTHLIRVSSPRQTFTTTLRGATSYRSMLVVCMVVSSALHDVNLSRLGPFTVSVVAGSIQMAGHNH